MLVGLVVLLVVLSIKPGPFDPLAHADDKDPPMADIPGGTFTMGSDDGPADEHVTWTVTGSTVKLSGEGVCRAVKRVSGSVPIPAIFAPTGNLARPSSVVIPPATTRRKPESAGLIESRMRTSG